MSCVLRGEVLPDEGTVGAVGQFGFWGAGQVVPYGWECRVPGRVW